MTRQAKHLRTQIRETLRRMIQPQAGALVTVSYVQDRLKAILGPEAPEQSTLYSWCEGKDVTFANALHIENVTGSTDLCELHCQLAGGRFVPDVRVDEREGTPIDVMRETADVLTAYTECLPGGFDAEERMRLRTEIAEARTALDRLAQAVEVNAA